MVWQKVANLATKANSIGNGRKSLATVLYIVVDASGVEHSSGGHQCEDETGQIACKPETGAKVSKADSRGRAT